MSVCIEPFVYASLSDFMALVGAGNQRLLAERYSISTDMYQEIVEAVSWMPNWNRLRIPLESEIGSRSGRPLLSIFNRSNFAPDAVQTWGVECGLLLDDVPTELTLHADVYLTAKGNAGFEYRLINVM